MSSTGHLSELDLLRNQVADLSRELAERDRSTQDLREQSALLRAIAEGTAAETGEEFFASLVIHLTSLLKVQYASSGRCREIASRQSAPWPFPPEAPSSTTSNMNLPIRPVPEH